MVVLHGYQGAISFWMLTLGELGVVAREQPCLILGDFNVEPGWVDLEAAWACASGGLPGSTLGGLLVGPFGLHGWLPSCSCSCHRLYGSG